MVLRQTLTGTIAGRYVVERELGYGASSVVYLARDLASERRVAVKLLRQELTDSIGAERFLREIRLIAALEHPAIVGLLDSGQHEGRPFCVLPYMEGGTLRERLEATKQLPVGEVVAIGVRIAEALDFAHRQNLIHRDVKPENILFHDGQACLADFGIARALERLAGDMTTTTGIVRGTPAYMSPEQAAGERDLDGRSDIYSLGCVLYESLAGIPAFVGPTPQSVLQQRILHTPRPVRTYRPTTPASIEQALNRAVATAPSDRWATAADFADALRSGSGSTNVTPGSTPRRFPLHGGSLWLTAGVVTLLVAALTARFEGASERTLAAADTTRVVVYPFRATSVSDADAMQYGLMAAIGQWAGVSVADRFALNEHVHGDADLSERDTRRIALSLKAGRYIQGEVRPSPNGLSVYAALYDVRNGRLHDLTSTIRGIDDTAGLRAIADSLLLRGGHLNSAVPMRNLGAVQAMLAGRAALDAWDLVRADSAFGRARAADLSSSQPALWRAQVRQWNGQTSAVWSEDATTAAADTLGLTATERAMATGLVALARHDYPAACSAYRRLVSTDSGSFAGWYGLGECQRSDPVVVPDARSPSGMRFRGSYQAALNAYLRSFELLPVTYRGYQGGAFSRLRSLLRTSSGSLRSGGDRLEFLGRLMLDGDSLLDVPMRRSDLASGRSVVPLEANARAVVRLRSIFFAVAARWSAAFPKSAEAKEGLALSLEMQGDRSAIDSLAAAARMAESPATRLRLNAERVLVSAKLSIPTDSAGLFSAIQLADSLVASNPQPDAATARVLAPLTALLGRCRPTFDLLRRGALPIQVPVQLPAGLTGEAAAALANAAMSCADSSVASVQQLASRIEQALPNAMQTGFESSLLGEITALAEQADSVALNRLSGADDYVLAARLELMRGHGAVAHEIVARRERLRRLGSPGSFGPNAALPIARIFLATGDTAAAARVLDDALADIRNRAPIAAGDPAQTVAWIGALGGAATLRATLSVSSSTTRAQWLRIGQMLSPRLR
jgi:tRNA A-37 threonylcarbamoyl transferase component Bud32